MGNTLALFAPHDGAYNYREIIRRVLSWKSERSGEIFVISIDKTPIKRSNYLLANFWYSIFQNFHFFQKKKKQFFVKHYQHRCFLSTVFNIVYSNFRSFMPALVLVLNITR